MGVLGAFFGCRGDAGFSGPLLGVSSGVVGFNVAMLSCLAHEKVRPAWLVGGDSGRKFAMCGQNAPNWAILGEQGEFCPAHAVRRGPLGEFCTGSGPARFLLGEFCTAVVRRGSCWGTLFRRGAVRVSICRASAAHGRPRPYPRAPQLDPPSRSGARRTGGSWVQRVGGRASCSAGCARACVQ